MAFAYAKSLKLLNCVSNNAQCLAADDPCKWKNTLISFDLIDENEIRSGHPIFHVPGSVNLEQMHYRETIIFFILSKRSHQFQFQLSVATSGWKRSVPPLLRVLMFVSNVQSNSQQTKA